MTKQEFSEKYGFNSSVGAFGIGTKDCRKELLTDLDNVIKALGLNVVSRPLHCPKCKSVNVIEDNNSDLIWCYDCEKCYDV